MISQEASRALNLTSSIGTCYPQDAGYWQSAVTRSILDLDEAGQHEAVTVIGAMLREQWGLLCTDPARAKPLAEVPVPVAELVSLSHVAADLDGYIERRAAELATPLIEQAEARADERLRSAGHEVQRQVDLVAELRKTLEVRDRQLAAAKAESRQNAEIAAACLDRERAKDAADDQP
jgi:hypothetical protein